MSNNIHSLDDARPHLTIEGLQQAHVVPISLIQDIALGTIKLSDVEGGDDFIPTLLLEWLNLQKGGK